MGFYLRGEEYSAQLEAFVERIRTRQVEGLNDFASAAVTDRALELSDDRRRARGPRRRMTERRPASVEVAARRALRGYADETAAIEPMDRLLFGDNQFFGVNHMSEEKARALGDALPAHRRGASRCSTPPTTRA